MEYWQFISATKDKTCSISEISELSERTHWTLKIECDDKVIYMGMDFESVEIVFKEVDE